MVANVKVCVGVDFHLSTTYSNVKCSHYVSCCNNINNNKTNLNEISMDEMIFNEIIPIRHTNHNQISYQ